MLRTLESQYHGFGFDTRAKDDRSNDILMVFRYIKSQQTFFSHFLKS